jgi:hypothetical protein
MRLRIIFDNIFLGIDSSILTLQFSQLNPSPFFGIFKTAPFFHWSGTPSFIQTTLIIGCQMSAISMESELLSSEDMSLSIFQRLDYFYWKRCVGTTQIYLIM